MFFRTPTLMIGPACFRIGRHILRPKDLRLKKTTSAWTRSDSLKSPSPEMPLDIRCKQQSPWNLGPEEQRTCWVSFKTWKYSRSFHDFPSSTLLVGDICLVRSQLTVCALSESASTLAAVRVRVHSSLNRNYASTLWTFKVRHKSLLYPAAAKDRTDGIVI